MGWDGGGALIQAESWLCLLQCCTGGCLEHVKTQESIVESRDSGEACWAAVAASTAGKATDRDSGVWEGRGGGGKERGISSDPITDQSKG